MGVSQTFSIRWMDKGREAQNPPNPQYPQGMDCDFGERPACKATLPYPAKRCGLYYIKCEVCGCICAVSTAGRPDDPRSIMVPCIIQGAVQ